MNHKQELFFEFVKQQHADQKRKYTGEPYWTHVFTVAKIASEYQNDLVEISLGHDLLEDTVCTDSTLESRLLIIGYNSKTTNFIVNGIIDLTDVYTPDNYPNLNRRERKLKEAGRLGNIHPSSQTVKYADLIHNTSSIIKYDKVFAKTYLAEKIEILKLMREGNKSLLKICEDSIIQNHSTLNNFV
ncbi:metal-dependent phosphohydrolase [Candidatus Kapabacteria bacterium]|nr:metal-dependent phosphohydrolase [Candidatus Kapabacteria bacterium]